MKRIVLCMFTALLLSACESSDSNEATRIGLPVSHLEIGAEGGEQVIGTAYDRWYIPYGLSVIGEDTLRFQNTLYTSTPRPGEMEEISNFKDTLQGSWYQVVKNGYDLEVKVEANLSGKEKKLMLELMAGDIPGETFTLVQKEK